MSKTWLITGVSSGFGYEMTKQLLAKGDVVIGTVRNKEKVQKLIDKYPLGFDCQILDVTDVPAVQKTVHTAFEKHEKIDVVVSNAGYGLFGCAEELSDTEIEQIIATNLTGSIQLIKTALPYMRKQGGGRIIQISSYGGQVAYPANSMYHATKFGIEGFCEAVAQEVAQFNIGLTIVEPGGARTEFRYGSAKVANLMPEYDSCHGFLNMLDASEAIDNTLSSSGVEEPAESEQEQMGNVQICIRCGEIILYADMYDSELAKEFVSQLPQSISMQRVGGGREFYGRLQNALSYDEADVQTTFENGDLAYWFSGNGLCLLYNNQVDKPEIESGIIVFGKITSDLSAFSAFDDKTEFLIEIAE